MIVDLEPDIFKSTVYPDMIVKRYKLNELEVCDRYDVELCNNLKNCKGHIGFGCKNFPKDYYKGISGYSG